MKSADLLVYSEFVRPRQIFANPTVINDDLWLEVANGISGRVYAGIVRGIRLEVCARLHEER